MAFYFALLNVSKKDDRSISSSNATSSSSTSSHHHRRHNRRHSIASVESPLTDYRLLPKPQLLSNDVVIVNEMAIQETDDAEEQEDVNIATSSCKLTRQSRGSAKASKWIEENRRRQLNNSTESTGEGRICSKQPLSRSKKMTFPTSKSDIIRTPRHATDVLIATSNLAVNQDPNRPPTRLPTRKKSPRPTIIVDNSATDDSRRSSHDSTILHRRDDSPASSIAEPSTSSIPAMISRSSEPRLKKVTFESSPYVISNTFLGDRAVLVRRGSGTAVRRMLISDEPTLQTTRLPKVLAPHDEVCGADWWMPCVVENRPKTTMKCDRLVNVDVAKMTIDSIDNASFHSSDNRANEMIEKRQRRLIRRRSTSDKSRIIAYRNNGFLSSSQERETNPANTSKMTSSVDRPSYY